MAKSGLSIESKNPVWIGSNPYMPAAHLMALSITWDYDGRGAE